MAFDILNQVKKEMDRINQERKKKDEEATEIRLDASEVGHINELEGDLKGISASARRFMDDTGSLKRKGIDTKSIINGIINELKDIFRV